MVSYSLTSYTPLPSASDDVIHPLLQKIVVWLPQASQVVIAMILGTYMLQLLIPVHILEARVIRLIIR